MAERWPKLTRIASGYYEADNSRFVIERTSKGWTLLDHWGYIQIDPVPRLNELRDALQEHLEREIASHNPHPWAP